MSVAILQFAPIYKNVEASIQKADLLLADAERIRHLDWIVLPEMAFTGEPAHIQRPLEASVEREDPTNSNSRL